MTSHKIFIRSVVATCLLLGAVGCSSSTSDSGDDAQSEATSEVTSDETSATATDEVVEISVIIGQTSGSAVAYQATLGSTVRLKI
ncbi:MAG: hypothetical protein F2741_04530, partial [Actinobacteria bacterium]|nr:hypothetical protein [Actinomycetota bacterium]